MALLISEPSHTRQLNYALAGGLYVLGFVIIATLLIYVEACDVTSVTPQSAPLLWAVVTYLLVVGISQLWTRRRSLGKGHPRPEGVVRVGSLAAWPQRQGAGRTLGRKLCAWADENGVDLDLTARSDSLVAVYAQHGFIRKFPHLTWMRRPPTSPTPAVNPPIPQGGGEAYLAVSQGRLDAQLATIDSLDTKSGIFIASALAEAAYLAALLAVRPSAGGAAAGLAPLTTAQSFGLGLSALLVVSTCVTGFLALAVRDWMAHPTPQVTWRRAYEWQQDDDEFRPGLEWELAFILDDAHEGNTHALTRKVRLVKYTLNLLAAQTTVVLLTTAALAWPALR